MDKNIKLKDIAEKLNISIVTVSNALSGKKGVSDTLRNKISETAESMGYKSTKLINEENMDTKIGIIVSEKYLGDTPSFYWNMYQKIAFSLSKKGVLNIFEIISNDEDFTKTPRVLISEDISGLIVIGPMQKQYISNIIDVSKVPVMLVDYYDDDFKCDAIISNNYIGMYRMTKYLVENGHKSIAFVGSLDASENIVDRYFGYKKCLTEFGLCVHESWAIEDRIIDENKMHIELPKHMPTSFACASDLAASTLYDELVKCGYNVPKDISIVGYDNYLYDHSFFNVLTTYDVNIEKMANVAVETLLKRIKTGNHNYCVRYIDGNIKIRKSVKNIKKHLD